MSKEKDERINETRRLSSEEVNKKAKSKKASKNASNATQVVGKVDSSKVKNKKGKEKKKKKKFKEKHPRIATIIRIILILILLFIIICAGIFFGALWGGYNFFDLLGDDYKIDIDELVVGYENSIVYDADGNEIATLSAGTKRKCVSLDEMGDYLPWAYVSIEDERFYEHSGVDFKRTAAATVTYITHGGSSSFGGSTITQQVVKNITNDKEDTALRKVKEMVKALQVEHYLSKDQILKLYLNLIFVGGKDVNGVALGAVYYFNKDIKDLSLAECAYMAAINNSPNSYNPFKEDENQQSRIDAGESRAKTVLSKMLSLGYISEDEYKDAVAEVDAGLNFSNGDTAVTTRVSYLTDAAIEEILTQMVNEMNISRDMAEIKLYSSGYKIYTTESSKVQSAVEEQMKDSYYSITSAGGQTSKASICVIDPKTGNVVGAGAGIGEEDSKMYLGYFNYVTDLQKQTGSSIKPLAVVSAGLETGKITASSTFYDGATTFPGAFENGSLKVFKNEGAYTEKYMTLREAIARSQNIPNLKAMGLIGTSNSAKFLQSVGITDVTGNEGITLALGALTHGASTLQMAAAYAMISNDGVYIVPTFYSKVEDGDGNVLLEPASVEDRSTRVMSSANAYIVKNIMTGPVTQSYGTAPYAKIDGIDVAAKTGTTNSNYDRWLVEFTNYYAAACWFGYDNNEEVYWSKTWNPAGTLCSTVMKNIHAGLDASSFVQPSGIVTATVCSYSGMKASENCTETYQEIFTEGTVPDVCDKHVTVRICNETGLLATEFCQDASEQNRIAVPNTESQGNWTTTYGAGYESLPTTYCSHTADSYTYED
jgi:penicillin-binding protein 1A